MGNATSYALPDKSSKKSKEKKKKSQLSRTIDERTNSYNERTSHERTFGSNGSHDDTKVTKTEGCSLGKYLLVHSKIIELSN